MNQKVYSLFFCVLLASTFVHEIRAKAAALPNFAPQIKERIADPILTCEKVCNKTGSAIPPPPLSLLVNVGANLTAIVNTTAKVGIVIDVNANISVLLNGTSGSAIVVNLTSNDVIEIKAGVWVAADATIEVYLASLDDGLTPLLETVGAVLYKAGKVVDSVLKQVNGILSCLIVNIDLQLQADIKVGLQLVIAISVQISGLLNGVLAGLLDLVGDLVITLAGDLANLLSFLLGLGQICGEVDGGLLGLLNAGVTLDLQVLLGLNDGLSILIQICLAIGAKLDLGAILGSLLNDVQQLLKLLANLGGNKNTGVAGLLKVLATIVAFIKGNIKIETVITVLIQFLAFTSQSVTKDLTATLNEALTALLDAIEQVGATEALAGLVDLVNALLKGTCVVGGVNLSVILQILITGVLREVGYLLTVLVLVVLQLTAVISKELGLLYCFVVLIYQCNCPYGINLLKALGITIDLTVKQILGGVIKLVLSLVLSIVALLLGDLYGACSRLPIIGVILRLLCEAIKSATGGNFDCKALLNSSGLIKGLILGLFQLVGGLLLFISGTVITQVKSVLNGCTSLNIYLSLDLTVILGVLV